MDKTIPKIWLAHSLTLTYHLKGAVDLKDYREFQEKVKPFKELLEKHQNVILENIPRFTGVKWQRKEIPVYILEDDKQKSFSHPLVLIWRDNIHNRLVVLIHELVHVNIVADYDDFFNLTNPLEPLKQIESEAVNWIIVKNVVNNIVSEDKIILEKELDIFANANLTNQEIFSEVNRIEKEWNLEKIPLKEWLRRSLHD